MENNTQIQRTSKEDRDVSFRVFGSDESIRLSIAIVRSTLVKPTKKGALPTDADMMKFIMICKAKGLNPYEGDAFLVGYDGFNGPEFSVISSHQSLLKRAEVNPEYAGIDSGVIVRDADGNIKDRDCDFMFEDDELLGGWATVYFKNERRPRKSRINLNIYAKDTKFWKGNPAGMIVKCAEADALRTSFPTKLGGLYITQEMARIERGEAIDVQSAIVPQDIKTLADKRESAQAAWAKAGEEVRGEQPKAIEVGQAETKTEERELADAGLAPEQPKTEARPMSVAESFQASVLDANSITFDQLRQWAAETGQLDNADSIGSLDEIPQGTIRKWAKMSKLIVTGIKNSKQTKGGELL